MLPNKGLLQLMGTDLLDEVLAGPVEKLTLGAVATHCRCQLLSLLNDVTHAK